MWTRRGGARLAVSLALWGLAGVALVLLPGLLAQNPSKGTEAPLISNPKSPFTIAITNEGSTPTAAPASSSGTDFLVRLLIMLVPVMALSTLGGAWISGRVRRAAV